MTNLLSAAKNAIQQIIGATGYAVVALHFESRKLAAQRVFSGIAQRHLLAFPYQNFHARQRRGPERVYRRLDDGARAESRLRNDLVVSLVAHYQAAQRHTR